MEASGASLTLNSVTSFVSRFLSSKPQLGLKTSLKQLAVIVVQKDADAILTFLCTD